MGRMLIQQDPLPTDLSLSPYLSGDNGRGCSAFKAEGMKVYGRGVTICNCLAFCLHPASRRGCFPQCWAPFITVNALLPSTHSQSHRFLQSHGGSSLCLSSPAEALHIYGRMKSLKEGPARGGERPRSVDRVWQPLPTICFQLGYRGGGCCRGRLRWRSPEGRRY